MMWYDEVVDKEGKKGVRGWIEYGGSFKRYMGRVYYVNVLDEKMDGGYDDVLEEGWICKNRKSGYM